MSYTFDSNNLVSDYNLLINKVRNALAFPNRKRPTEYSFEDIHGVTAFTDESDIRWDARDIIIDCYLQATTRAIFEAKLETLKGDLKAAGLKTLDVSHSLKTYEVYYRDESILTKINTWNTIKNAGKVTLVFRESMPIFPALWRGLNGHWTMAQSEEAGGDQQDQTDYDNDGTLVNTAYANDRKGTANKCIDLNGADAYIDIGDTNQNIKSVSLWIYPDDNTDRDIIDFDGGTHVLRLDALGDLDAVGFSSPSYYVNGVSGQAVSQSAWSHVVIFTSTEFEASDMDIGRETNYFDGKVDDVKIYNRVLTTEEIKILCHKHLGVLDI